MSIGIKGTKRKRSSMKNIQKLILEAYGDIKEEKETIKLDTLPKAMQDRLKDRYGEFSKHDFISSDMGTYFKTIGVNKTTGQVSHKIIALPSFANLYNEYKGIIADIKSLMRSDDVRKDKEARELFELIKTNFRKLQRYLRTERPEQYELIRMRASLQEIHEMFISHASLIKEQRADELKIGTVKNIEIFVNDQSSISDTMFYKLVDKNSGKEFEVSVDVAGEEVDLNYVKEEIPILVKIGFPAGDAIGNFIVKDINKELEEGMHESEVKNENPNFTILKKGPYYRYLPTDDLTTDLRDIGTHGRQRSKDNLAVIKTADELLDILDDMHMEDPERAIAFSDQNNDIIKFQGKVLNESMLDEVEDEEEPTPEEEPDTAAPEETVLEDATDKILGRFPTVKAALVKLQTDQFKEFVDSIDWISPRPSSFRINLKNGQDYILKWTGKTFEAQIMGKRYILSSISEYQQALDKLAILYKEAPMTGAGEGEPADTDTGGGGGGGGGDFPGEEGGGGEGDAVDDLGGEEGDDAPPADLGGEEIDFEDAGEEPEA
tara:strand:+ start:1068 stop:2711 length:1644 start_codon:yes stop_codon:yes gene_type:complete